MTSKRKPLTVTPRCWPRCRSWMRLVQRLRVLFVVVGMWQPARQLLTATSVENHLDVTASTNVAMASLATNPGVRRSMSAVQTKSAGFDFLATVRKRGCMSLA